MNELFLTKASNEIRIYGEITNDSYVQWLNDLKNLVVDIKERDDDDKRIFIYYNSVGGTFTCAKNLASVMNMYKKEYGIRFISINIAMVASSAIIPFMVSNVEDRISLPASMFLVHECRLQIQKNHMMFIPELDYTVEKCKLDTQFMAQLILDNTTMAEEDIEKRMFNQKDYPMDANEALSKGFINFIIP